VRALVVDRSVDSGIALREVPEPRVGPDEVVVDVRAISLNRGELRMLASAPDGLRPGWDFAGILRTDVDGGPNAGERVVGIRRGQAWAERVSAPGNWLAALPDGITFTQAAALPTAGLTALRTLRFGPAILGRRVLVTGASGGVGRFAVQLAHLGGADVTALVSRPERAAGLAELGADRVVADPDNVSGRFDLILESVGGSTLARLLTRLDPEGTLITFGNSSDETTTFNVSDVYPDALVRIRGFEVFYAPDPFARDLRFLADLVADGKLDPQLADEMPWEAMPKALQRLENRDVAGKVALTINV